MISKKGDERISGLIYGISAYLFWGFLPIYWKALQSVPPFGVLVHRIIWSFAFLVLLFSVQGKWIELKSVLSDRKNLIMLATSSMLLFCNWFVYIWALLNDHVIETSLGYFICPLISVLIGMIILKERLNRWQLIAIALAFLGMLNSVMGFGQFPWIALLIALTFSFYSLMRKTVRATPLVGLGIEMGILAPLALGFLIYLDIAQTGSFAKASSITNYLLVGTGVVSVLPLMWMTKGLKRLRMSTMGLLLYLLPTGHLILGIFVYKEPFNLSHFISFVLIWSAIVLYSINSIYGNRIAIREKN